jgi:cellulose synthase (UDP-forming)
MPIGTAAEIEPASATGSARPAHVLGETRLTRAALAVTICFGILAVSDIVAVLGGRILDGQWIATATQIVFLLVVAYLLYGACVYLVARLGYFRRLHTHRRASTAQLRQIERNLHGPLVTVLVPSYMEERHVVRRTLLSVALQTYPHKRVVLLIDDPPSPASAVDAARLSAARRLPDELARLIGVPYRRCSDALAAFRLRQAPGRPLDPRRECEALAELHENLAAWLDTQADEYVALDHADRFFVETIFRAPAQAYRAAASAWRTKANERRQSLRTEDVEAVYEQRLAKFAVELTSFERKRFENLSHEPNKAMNLNAYLALLGRKFCHVWREGQLWLEPADAARFDLDVPASEFVLVVDADSVLLPEYTARLVHLLCTPGNERVAIAQTPYSAFPGAPGVLERVAGATTDIQYVIHQGFTAYDGTYWVGANALIRTAALEEIATDTTERGHVVPRFVQDRTLIEDTESTVDLLARGWRLANYPERLAYSETPPDFGALVIQRRRWANGGLLIVPKLMRHLLRASRGWQRLVQGFVMTHYLTSLAAVNTGLLLVMAFAFDDSMRSTWLPFTALPYYLLNARDLRHAGLPRTDVLRVYALNLVLIPVNLAGVFSSLYQLVTGTKAAFGRTPKLPDRTRVPALYLVAMLGLAVQWVLRVASDLVAGHEVHAALTAVNVGFLVYGITAFIGVAATLDDLGDGARALISVVSGSGGPKTCQPAAIIDRGQPR